MSHGICIAPSVLSVDFARLADQIAAVEAGGADWIHVDVMDGHFVPNLSLGVPIVEAVRRVTDLTLDVHLMISYPVQFVEPFRSAGADLITIHIEVAPDPRELLARIHGLGAGAGIAINPPTPVQKVEGYLDHCDLVLTMSVMPGFGGQQFQPVALEKLCWLKERAPKGTLLSVDGGVNLDTIGPCAEAGANLFVTGTALLGEANYDERFAELRSLATTSSNVPT